MGFVLSYQKVIDNVHLERGPVVADVTSVRQLRPDVFLRHVMGELLLVLEAGLTYPANILFD